MQHTSYIERRIAIIVIERRSPCTEEKVPLGCKSYRMTCWL